MKDKQDICVRSLMTTANFTITIESVYISSGEIYVTCMVYSVLFQIISQMQRIVGRTELQMAPF